MNARALGLVTARRERLLELIDSDDQPVRRRGLGGGLLKRTQRMLARTQQRQRPTLAARQHAAGERGEQPGPQRR